MSKNVVIIGAGSVAKYVVDIFWERQDITIRGFVDVIGNIETAKVLDKEVIKGIETFLEVFSPSDAQVIAAIGDNRLKKETVNMLEKQHYKFVSAISKRAYISGLAQVGHGCIINAGAMIMPGATVGNHVIIHSNCCIEHDNSIKDFANIASGVSLGGNVEVGIGAYIYTGASVIPKVKIGDWSLVGAGAVVIKNVPTKETHIGVPAKALIKQEKDR